MDEELEVLSDQHTQKCLENSQLNQELQDERQALIQSQKENQELKKKQVQTLSFNKALKINNACFTFKAISKLISASSLSVLCSLRERQMQCVNYISCLMGSSHMLPLK